MTYEDFMIRNDLNKYKFKCALRKGAPKLLSQYNQDPYISSSIEKVDFSRADGVVVLASERTSDLTVRHIEDVITNIFNSTYAYVINPSCIREWKGFNE